MKRYCVKCRSGRIEYFDVLGEADEGYQVQLTCLSDGTEKTTEEFMSRHLFDLCLRTGYIYEMNRAESSVA